MRILYGVTGCGLGHTMRARALSQHLRSRGHEVKLAASSRAVGILRQHGLDVVAIDGMTMRFEAGEVRRGLHTRRETHACHAAGSLACLALLAAAVAFRQPVLAVVGPIVDYAVAQASQRLFESNRTMPWKNQAWHTRAEMRMLRLVLTGRMAAEVTRCTPGG